MSEQGGDTKEEDFRVISSLKKPKAREGYKWVPYHLKENVGTVYSWIEVPESTPKTEETENKNVESKVIVDTEPQETSLAHETGLEGSWKQPGLAFGENTSESSRDTD